MVLLLRTISELRSHLKGYRQANQGKIGLVPTMGALHQGHLSLITKAIAENSLVVVSIFVNPLQFAPTEDLANYPRQLEQDLQLCESMGVDLVFAPTPEEMNSRGDTNALNNKTTVIPPQSMTQVLCGKYRPDHFTGVASIVTQLFNIIQPDKAYFGQKDAQQLAIIRRLVQDLNIPVAIVPGSIIREASGLALSSRNQYLTKLEKKEAAKIYESLQQVKLAFTEGEINATALIDLVKQKLANSEEVKIQYIELVDPVSLQAITQIKQTGLLAIAVYVGSTRLIDNIVLQKRQPIIAIDGPAGAGKSTVTRSLAHQLGLLYLDTGAMYRAVTWLVQSSGIAINDHQAIANLLQDLDLKLTSPSSIDLPTVVEIDGQDVTTAIRTLEVTANVSAIAAISAVREKLVEMQQQWGEQGGLIAEGRDIGTNVFPHAELKIFLTATASERARRRLQDLQAQGINDIDLQQLEQDIQRRDEQDSNRAISPLKKADDAIELITDNLSINQVIDKIAQLYRQLVASY
ncbi:cytidylate kinase [Pleurocapsa sp. CCALA 161]|uniref:bifunctional pantoate--beta-alanine ligase/(d)CMP kinase n=1 Tax=Pleurocapsa sp. CCALA 161 TaxID=2107688 RepID=UPI000D05B647|nr:bifunctional pantoate--beta-alanine ligase/(d)CMP kinase [Pleurocapsa sp. CCALA 161]PSB10788.1 cytidylate kinase [Pleurocapsa sp. CCALA 161]